MSQDKERGATIEEAAVQQAEANSDWWNEQWMLFPTVRLDADGLWHYWEIPEDSGIYGDDWSTGANLARQTVAHMQRFTAGSTVLRRIFREMDQSSTVAQGFIQRIEDMLTHPDVYLDSLEPGAVQAKLKTAAKG